MHWISPTPGIIACCTDRNNPVGAEYILEEKAQGQPLGEFWKDWNKWPMEDRFGIIEQLVNIERKLASTKIMKWGSIYLRKDIPNSEALQTDPPLPSKVLERLR
jgi:hypothetical protein